MKSMWLGIWMMGVGISANASCVDFTGVYNIWDQNDPLGSNLPVSISLSQKDCEQVDYKANLWKSDGVAERTAFAEPKPEVAESDFARIEVTDHFTGTVILLKTKLLIKSNVIESEELMILELISPEFLKLNVFKSDGLMDQSVSTHYYKRS